MNGLFHVKGDQANKTVNIKEEIGDGVGDIRGMTQKQQNADPKETREDPETLLIGLTAVDILFLL